MICLRWKPQPLAPPPPPKICQTRTANAEANNVVAVADNSTDITMEKPAAETGTTPELTRTPAGPDERQSELSKDSRLRCVAAETSEDETTLGLYRQFNSQCESRWSTPIGCIPTTRAPRVLPPDFDTHRISRKIH